MTDTKPPRDEPPTLCETCNKKAVKTTRFNLDSEFDKKELQRYLSDRQYKKVMNWLNRANASEVKTSS